MNGPDKIERNTYCIVDSDFGSALGVLLNRLREFQTGNPDEIWISKADYNSLFTAYCSINDVMPHQKALEDDIAALKKKIKHAKTPMERNALSKQLNVAYKQKKKNKRK